MMSILNRILGSLVEWLMLPFAHFAPIVGLTVFSALTAVGMLLVVKATSNQARLEAVKRSIHAGLFEIRLFNDDIRAILRAQGEILRHNLTYLRLSAVPLLWTIAPLVLLVAQLEFYYGYGGMETGQAALVTVRLTDDWRQANSRETDADDTTAPALALEAPPGLRVETPAVWVPSLNEATWRIGAERPGEYELTIRRGDQSFAKTVHVSNGIARRSPVRLEGGLVNQLLYPAEPPLPAGSLLQSITVSYPEQSIRMLGWDIHWMIVFFVLSTVFAFALKGRFGVVL